MKKLFVFLMVLCVLASSACADTLAQEACKLAQQIDAMGDNEEYLKILIGSGDVIGMARQMAEGDYNEPTMMVSVDLTNAKDLLLKNLVGEFTLEDPAIRENLMGRVNTAMIHQVVATRGALALAATSVLTAGNLFACDMEPGDGMFLIFYGEYTPVAVSWVAKNGAVSMSAMFVPLEELAACTTPEMVADWFAGMGMQGAVVTPVE